MFEASSVCLHFARRLHRAEHGALSMVPHGLDCVVLSLPELFSAEPGARRITGMPAQLLLSAFAHLGLLHLFVNMSVLYSFTPLLGNSLGPRQAAFLYVSGGLINRYRFSLRALYSASQCDTRNFSTSLGTSVALVYIFCQFTFLDICRGTNLYHTKLTALPPVYYCL